MKKTCYKIIKTLFFPTLIAVLSGFSPATASAQTAQSKPFLSGFNLAVTATSTNTFGGTNIYAKGFTMTNSATYPYVSGYLPTTVTNTGAFSDVQMWADRDGTTPAANISVQMVGSDAAFTNTALFKFVAIPADSRSANYPPGLFVPATTQNTFQFSVTGTGLTPVSIATNLPTAFIQGCRGLRLSSIEWTHSGTNGTVAGVFLNGFTPTP